MAAAEVFAEKGYDGARVDEIAHAAGVNKATLYYQIGDKKTLYEAIIIRVISQMADEIETSTRTAVTGAEQLQKFIESIAHHAGIARQFAPIMLREIADGGRHLPEEAIQQMGRILEVLNTLLEQGRRSGEFRRVNPLITHMLIIGSILLYHTNEPIRARVRALNRTYADNDYFIPTTEVAAHVVDLVLASVRNVPGGDA